MGGETSVFVGKGDFKMQRSTKKEMLEEGGCEDKE